MKSERNTKQKSKRVLNLNKEFFFICSCPKKQKYYGICCIEQYFSVIEGTQFNEKRYNHETKARKGNPSSAKTYISTEAKKQNNH